MYWHLWALMHSVIISRRIPLKRHNLFTDALAHYAVTLLAQYLVPLYKHVKAMAEGKSAVLNETQLTKAWESVTLASNNWRHGY